MHGRVPCLSWGGGCWRPAGGLGAVMAGRESWEKVQHGEEQELNFPMCGIKASGAGA